MVEPRTVTLSPNPGDLLPPTAVLAPKSGPGVYLIRNAPSLYDYWSKRYSVRARRYNGGPGPEPDPDYKFLEEVKTKWDPRLLDPGLHKRGAKEASLACANLAAFNVKYVLVSPMRRALETCRIMLSGRQDRDKIKVFVVPLLRTLLSNAEDIPYKSVSVVKKEFEKEGFNYTLLSGNDSLKDLFFLETMNSPDKEKILDALSAHKGEDYAKVILDVAVEKRRAEKKGHRKLETYENMRRRAVQLSEFLGKFVRDTGLMPDDDVLIFTHGPVVRYCMSVFWGPDGRALAQKTLRCLPYGFDYTRLLELETQFHSSRALRTGLTVQLMPGGGLIKAEETSKVLIVPLQTCARGHRLLFSHEADQYAAFDCVKCLRGGRCIDGRWNCLFCKYNLCPKCKPPPDSVRKLCIRGHSLEEAAVPEEAEAEFVCGRCGKKGRTEPGGRRWCCPACSYDVCSSCISSQLLSDKSVGK